MAKDTVFNVWAQTAVNKIASAHSSQAVRWVVKTNEMRMKEAYLSDKEVKPSAKDNIIMSIEQYFEDAEKIRDQAITLYQTYDLKLSKCQTKILELSQKEPN